MRWRRGRAALAGPLALGMSILWLAAECTPAAASPLPACTQDGRTLEFGFYAHFEPVSHSAAAGPGSPGFDSHRGYESDLLDALEAMDGAGLGFSRRGIADWDGLWLLPSGPRFDLVGGGITILDSRTRDAAGRAAIVFTSGHISVSSISSGACRRRRAARPARRSDRMRTAWACWPGPRGRRAFWS